MGKIRLEAQSSLMEHKWQKVRGDAVITGLCDNAFSQNPEPKTQHLPL
jgi:hypothetical protein